MTTPNPSLTERLQTRQCTPAARSPQPQLKPDQATPSAAHTQPQSPQVPGLLPDSPQPPEQRSTTQPTVSDPTALDSTEPHPDPSQPIASKPDGSQSSGFPLDGSQPVASRPAAPQHDASQLDESQASPFERAESTSTQSAAPLPAVSQSAENSQRIASQLAEPQPAVPQAVASQLAVPQPIGCQPTGVQPTAPRSDKAKPADLQPTDPQPARSEPVGSELADAQPVASQPADSQQAVVARLADSQPIDSPPADSQPIDCRPEASQPAGSHTADSHPAGFAEPDTATSSDAADRVNEPTPTQTSDARRHGHKLKRDQVRLARAYLMRVAEPPATALLALVDAVGPVEAAAAVRAAEVPPRVLVETSARRHLALAESDLVDADRVGARLVVPEDEEWPAWPLLSLAAASDRGQRWAGSALGLWARGPAPLADTFERAVSVVGARAATGYGEFVAGDVAHGVASAGMTVVSGAAYGIDGCAHRGALAAEGTTVAVLGCGVDVGYPAGHATLLDRIAERGLVLSEYPPGTPPARYRFLVRNRLIAALSSGTVVVEAGVRSGARNTATTAAALGKVVLAVPGPITSAMSAGCHDLLRTGGAMLAGSVSDILEAVGPVGEHMAERPESPSRRTDGLGDEALRVHDALRRRASRTPAQVAVESGVPIDRVRALLTELELTGLVERREEGWCRAPDS